MRSRSETKVLSLLTIFAILRLILLFLPKPGKKSVNAAIKIAPSPTRYRLLDHPLVQIESAVALAGVLVRNSLVAKQARSGYSQLF